MGVTYPTWAFFPRRSVPPGWVHAFLLAVEQHKADIDSAIRERFTSDQVVALLRPSLLDLGWQVEAGKKKAEKIERPVLFGDNGHVVVKQEIDGWHPELNAILEVESGRAIHGNAIYRDLVRASLVTEADYLVLGVRQTYTYTSGGKLMTSADFTITRDALDSVYASGRLQLPFRGVLLFGW